MAYDEYRIRKALGIGPDEKFIIVKQNDILAVIE